MFSTGGIHFQADLCSKKIRLSCLGPVALEDLVKNHIFKLIFFHHIDSQERRRVGSTQVKTGP